MNSKNVLMVLGIAVLVMGLWSLLTNWVDLPTLDAVEPAWHAVVKVVVGAFATYVAFTEKK